MEQCIARAAELAGSAKRDDRPLMLCSTHELMQALAERSENLTLGIQFREDGNKLETFAVVTGNKAACKGLSDMLSEHAMQTIMAGSMIAGDEPGDDDGDDPDDDEDDDPRVRSAG